MSDKELIGEGVRKMVNVRERNKEIKKVLGKVFGHKNVRVKGGRGTAFGWVEVKIRTKINEREVRDIVYGVLKANGLWDQLYTYYDEFGDPHKEIIIEVVNDDGGD